MLLLSGLPGHLLRRPHLPTHGLAPQAAFDASRRRARSAAMSRVGENHADAGSPVLQRATMPPGALTRRRAMTILGGIAGVPLLGAIDRPNDAVAVYRWSGTSLGSPSRLLICHPDGAAAGRMVAHCVAEITRLERVFALYRPDSELARLNRDGRLANPCFDLLTVLSQCRRLSALSSGAFDVTVQPLWNLY